MRKNLFMICNRYFVIMGHVDKSIQHESKKESVSEKSTTILYEKWNHGRKGTRSETGIKLFKIVGRQKPTINQSRFETFKNLFTVEPCECEKQCQLIFFCLGLNLDVIW